MAVSMDRQTELTQLRDTAKQGWEGKYKAYHQMLEAAYLCRMSAPYLKSLIKRFKSHVYFPYIRSKVEKLLTSFMAVYFSNPDIVSLSATNPNNPVNEQAAIATQNCIRYYIQSDKTPVQPIFERAMLDAALKGTFVLKAFWDTERNAPQIMHIELQDIWFDPVATGPDDCKFYVHRMYLTGEYVDKLRKDPSFIKGFEITDSEPSVGQSLNSSLPEKYRRYVMYDVYEKREGGWTISTLIGNTVVRDKYPLNDGLPIFVGKLLPQIKEVDEYDIVQMYGTSPMEVIIPLQENMNRVRNQQNDAISQQLNPRWFSERSAGLQITELENNSGVVQTNSVQGIREITPPNIAQSEYNVQQLDLEMQTASGITSYNTGQDSPALNDTATGIAILTREANQKIEYFASAINETIEPLMAHVAQLCWFYGEDRFFFDVPLPREVPLDLFAHADTGIGATSPQIQAQGLRELAGMFLNVQDIGAFYALLPKLMQLIGIKESGEILNGSSYLNGQQGLPAGGNGGQDVAGAGVPIDSGGGVAPSSLEIEGMGNIPGNFGGLPV